MAEVSIADINAAIAALVESPKVDYKIGDKTVKAGQKMAQLLALRRELMTNPASDIKLIAFDALNIDEFGTDNSQQVL